MSATAVLVASWALLHSMARASPVSMEMVDMTHVFDNNTLYLPIVQKFQVVVTNGSTPDGSRYQTEDYRSSTHAGTHFDAPCHFASGRWHVEDIPMDRLIAEAAVVDIRERAAADSDAEVRVRDLVDWEEAHGKTLDHKVVLILSGWGHRWPDREAYTGTPDLDSSKLHYPAMSREAAQWLVDNRDIYGLGTDTLSLDNGSFDPASPRAPWTHRILMDRNIYGMESLANVDKLPSSGATLIVMPMKIGQSCGAPVRVVALFPKIFSSSYK